MAEDRTPRRRLRDSDATRERILKAALREFAAKGLGGARVDEIAERADANKRMIYHYFGSKDDLFRIVVENAYAKLRAAEARLNLDALDPEEALAKLVAFTFEYYIRHPEFVVLVNSANLHKARHVRDSEAFRKVNTGYVSLTERLLARGVAAGRFRPDVDPVQLTMTIAAVGFYYFTNRHTLSIIFGRDLKSKEQLAQRLRFNVDSILRIVRIDPAAPAVDGPGKG